MGLKDFYLRNEPSIMTWTGAGLLLCGTIEGIRVTPGVTRKLEELKNKKPIEKLKAVWKYYIPTAVASASGLALIGVADKMNHQRNAALMTGLTLTQTALSDYRDEVKRALGDKKEEEIQNNVIKTKIDQHPVPQNLIEGSGASLCYDPYCDRYFWGSVEAIRKAAAHINRELSSGNDVEIEDFYDDLRLSVPDFARHRGWRAESFIHNNRDLDVYIVPHMARDDTPCIAFRFNEAPEMGYMYNTI